MSTTTEQFRADPVLGDILPETGGRIIAWGHVDAGSSWAPKGEPRGVEQERWCILTLLAPEKRIPNVANYEVLFLYPDDGPISKGGVVEASEQFANIGPAVVDGYAQWGMDW